MSWNPITPAQALTQGFSPQEQGFMAANAGGLAALTTAAQQVITDEINAAQGAIIAGGSQQGAAGTLPDQLRPDLMAIIRWRILASFPALKALQTKERESLFTAAQGKLEKVSNGEIKIEIPTAGTAQTNPAPVNAAAVVRPGRKVCTTDYDGIGNT